jgi:ubiquinone/menaquinone biosynthesis C-methylase UbiE
MLLKVPASLSEGRVNLLAERFLPCLSSDRALTVLDVGCGHGYLTKKLQEALPKHKFVGADVVVRPGAAVPVSAYDGKRLPFEDETFDVVMAVDVLHHAEDPPQLLRECCRVARDFVLIKDHTCEGLYDWLRLALLDWFGNRTFGIPMTYRYFSRDDWRRTIDSVKAQIDSVDYTLATCPEPLSFFCDRGLHLLLKIAPSRACGE